MLSDHLDTRRNLRKNQGGDLKWNLTPNRVFLPADLGAWHAQPIRINRLSPSPDPEAEFTARADFTVLIDDFLRGIGRNHQSGASTPPDADDVGDPAVARENEEERQGLEIVNFQPATQQNGETPTSPQSTPHHRRRKHSSTSWGLMDPHSDEENSKNEEDIQGRNMNGKLVNNMNNLPARRTSRPKRKCFKKKETPLACNLAKRMRPSAGLTSLPTEAKDPCSTSKSKHKVTSRPKKKCAFGPGKEKTKNMQSRDGQAHRDDEGGRGPLSQPSFDGGTPIIRHSPLKEGWDTRGSGRTTPTTSRPARPSIATGTRRLHLPGLRNNSTGNSASPNASSRIGSLRRSMNC